MMKLFCGRNLILIAFLLSTLVLQSTSITCSVGYQARVALVGINKMKSIECPADGNEYKCIMVHAKFRAYGFSGEGSIGQCIPVDECTVEHCSNPLSLIPDKKNIKQPFTIQSCEEKCCSNSDECH